MFANALLARHDITALIRDTETHERSLFSVAPPCVSSKSQGQQFTGSVSVSTNSGQQASTGHGTSSSRQPKRNTAVATVLGGHLYRKIQNASTGGDANAGYGQARNTEKGDLDVDILLEGAEKLCNVYPISGADEKIVKLRSRFQQLSANIAHYEDRVSRNSTQLQGMYQRQGHDAAIEEEEPTTLESSTPKGPRSTREDLAREEQEIRELERKKRGLEERVSGMEKDLGGLTR